MDPDECAGFGGGGFALEREEIGDLVLLRGMRGDAGLCGR